MVFTIRISDAFVSLDFEFSLFQSNLTFLLPGSKDASCALHFPGASDFSVIFISLAFREVL